MKVIGRNWKAVLSVLLLVAAVLVYVLGYRPRSEAYVLERDQLKTQITALQTTIVENEKYKDVQDQLEPAEAAIEESRAALYENFPADMKEEDQNKKLEFVKKVKETKFNQELFFKQMKLFSQFVTYTNPDYMYNETYLLRFCQQYAKFQSYICKKYEFKTKKDLTSHILIC